MKWKKEYEDLGFDDTTASVLDVDRVQEVIRRRAHKYKVRVNWEANGVTAVTRNLPNDEHYEYEIDIPAIVSPCTKEDLIRTYMFVVHECGHLMRPEVWDIATSAQPNATLQSIFNIVEDDSMERDVANRALGDARVLGEGNAVMCKDGELYWQEAVEKARADGVPFTEDTLKPMICMAIQCLSRKEWDGWSREAIDKWLRVMPPEGMDLMVALVKEGWVEKFRATATPYDSWQVACDLYERLYPTEDEEEQNEREEVRQAGATGTPREQVDDESTDMESGEGPGRDDAGDSEAVGETEGAEDTTSSSPSEQEGYVISWEEVGISEHRDSDQPHGNGGAMGITYRGRSEQGGVAFAPDNKINVIRLDQSEDLDDRDTWRHSRSRRRKAAHHFNPCNKDGAVLANKMRRYIQSHTRARVRNEQESGHINTQDLARLLMPPVDGGNWNKRVFYDLQRKRAINTAIHILVDWSGSMAGKKAETAAQAAIRAAEVFGRQLRMPTMVSAFTTYLGMCDIGVIKSFDRPRNPADMADSFAEFTKWHGGNNDADSVLWAYRRLMERKEPRKILLVMSDGAPAGSYKGDYHSALLAATRHIQDEGKVELYGLGLMSQAVDLYYNKHRVIHGVDEINEGLLTLLAEGVKYE